MGSSGVGATVGALWLAQRERIAGIDRWIAGTTIFFGLALMGFAFSRSLWFSCALLSAVGIGLMVNLSGINALLQDMSDEEYRGRVMGFYALMFLGVAPIGHLIAGHLAKRIGAPYTVALGASACVLIGLAYIRRLPQSVDEYRLDTTATLVVAAPPDVL